MKVELATRYEPASIEQRIYRVWEAEKSFRSEVDPGREPYVIVIPPPNVTGALHMGHALNNTLQDILIRWRRMQGNNACWLPGTDHAGIATQNVVEREIAQEGLDRHSLGREKLIERIWQWKEQYGGRITMQLKRLGCSCDWDRTRFTMDDGLSRAVRENFVRLYEKDLIYRGNYIINWCPRCRTSLSDDEVDHKDVAGHLWYIRYDAEDGGEGVVVATTRPETMLGDTAVAVNPKDVRFAHLVGKNLILPVIGRRLPVITDDFVDPKFGTGAVKVTPAHDLNDYEMGRRHDLAEVSVMNDDGTMNGQAGDYAGMDRYACREKLVERLQSEGRIGKIEEHTHAIGLCYRCEETVEPRLSLQWFVRMRPLADRALAVQDEGRVTFCPERWTKVYRSWLENVRDWCISRQIWWGHRIPVWYCDDCGHVNVSREDATRCAECGSAKLSQDEDVLDTWFSSALWPFSTFGWPDEGAREELEYYYPTSVLVTARDIIYFWVARMIMMGLEVMGDVPFRTVVINGTVLDEIGRRMSKSLGNGIDPIEMIDEYGGDAVRFSLAVISTDGQDIKLGPTRFEMGRNFANKLWNASRFSLLNMEDIDPPEARPLEELAFTNRWVLSRLAGAARAVTDAMERFAYSEAAMALYAFVWHEFCDWYLELSKAALRGDQGARVRAETQQVLAYTLDATLRLLHPFIPFITEELWTLLGTVSPLRTLDGGACSGEVRLVVSPWPVFDDDVPSPAADATMKRLQDIIRAARNVRGTMGIAGKIPVPIVVSCENGDVLSSIAPYEDELARLANLSEVTLGVGLDKPPASAAAVLEGIEVFVPLADLIDLDAERKRLQSAVAKLESQLAAADARLAGEGFLSRAPEEVVQRHRDMRDKTAAQLKVLRENLDSLGEQ